jgi:hypothetical protein
MSSWSLLTALSGFEYSAPERSLRFRPRVRRGDFRCLYSAGTAWGSYAQKLTKEKLEATLGVEGGRLQVATLRLPYLGTRAAVRASVPATVAVEHGEAALRFAPPLKLDPGETVRLAVSAAETGGTA